MKKNQIIPVTILALVFMVFESVAQNRVVDRSSRQRPEWVDGVMTNYIIALGSGHSIDAARQNAMIRVKEMIVNSVANNVRTKSELRTEQVNNNNVFRFLEHFTSQTLTQSANLPYLQGISPSRAEDFYWEIVENRRTKAQTIYYHIKYPFPHFELMMLIDEFVKADRYLTDKLESTIASLETFTTVEELVQYIGELEHMANNFIDQRKSKADLALIQARTMLGSIQLIELENIPGRLVYNLQLGNRIITTSGRPTIRSKCAIVNSVLPRHNSTVIEYDYANCYDDPANNLQVLYRFDNARIENTFFFNVKQFRAEIFVTDDIHFRALDWQGDYITHFECFITVISRYESPFFIDRIVLEFRHLPPVIFNDLNLEFEGKGAHRITLNSQQTLEAAKYSSLREGLNLLSGSIIYGPVQTRQATTYQMFNQKFSTDW